MKLNKNTIAVLKGFVCPPNDGMDNRIAVSTVQAHLMSFGYMLDEDAFMEMAKTDLSWIEQFNNEAISFLKVASGGKYNFRSFYKNFPQEVMSLSDSQLFWNAMCHYWLNGTWEPSTVTYEREIKFEKVKYTMLKYADAIRFDRIFTDLVSINTSLTPTDLNIVKWFVNSEYDLIMPPAIPFKENLCTLAAMGIPGLPIKTPTDVLRIAVHLSGGDISLPSVPQATVKASSRGRGYSYSTGNIPNPERDKFKFKKFSRSERRYLLSLLEQTHCNPAEMVLKDQRWIRLGEILHPGEYKSQFPKSYDAFNAIRNDKVMSWYGQVDKAFQVDFSEGLKKLSERPGEFARRLDALVRKNDGAELKGTLSEKLKKISKPKDRFDEIMAVWNECVKGTSNKVLFEQYEHFERRREPKDDRHIFIKGARRPIQLPSLAALDPNKIEAIHQSIFGWLKYKFSLLEPLGNVWIDEELKKIPLPTNMRSMNFSLKPTIRGQRRPFGNAETKVIRPFVHWMDPHGSEDLDLSATFVGKRYNVLSYSNLMVGESVHSGDVRHRQGPCAEYIDIDINDALDCDYKYVLIDVRNFNGGSLKFVDTMFGFMEREYPEANDLWLPETVSVAMTLQSEASNTLAVILDLETKEYIFMDIDSDGFTSARSDIKSILDAVKMYTQDPKVSVYDLCFMHAESRGKHVTIDSNVDTYFKAEDFMDSYENTAKLML